MKEQLFNYPEYVEVNNKRYKINTDFRVAIKCNEISMQDIDIVEKGMAIIYMLFGEEALNDMQNYEELIKKAEYFLKCGNVEENENKDFKEPDMDFVQDYPYIEASFMYDYKINLEETNMHWWKFYNLMCGLSNSEFGNCCILNKIRSLRDLDLSKIDDPKERENLRKAKEQFALKKYKRKKEFTNNEISAMEEYHKLLGD